MSVVYLIRSLVVNIITNNLIKVFYESTPISGTGSYTYPCIVSGTFAMSGISGIGTLIVNKLNDNDIFQTLILTNHLYTRNRTNNTWSVWTTIV